jgi:hypothetical protein
MNNFKPHLACDVDFTKLKFPVWGMRKIDGVRMLNVGGKAVGRSLKSHANKHTTKEFSQEQFSGYDGEVTFGYIRGDSLCRDTTSVLNRIEGSPDVVWNLFDYLLPSLLDKPYKERCKALEDHCTLYKDKRIQVVPYTVLSNIEEAEAFYQESLDLGFEGAIFRDPEAKHKSGRCTAKEAAYTRAKPQSDKEAHVIALVEAMENLNEAKVNELGHTERSSHKENKVGKGMVGSFICKDVTTGAIITVGAGKATHEERMTYWNNPDVIVGKYIKYLSMDTGVKDAPRFARYICIRSEEDMSSDD